jgi:hypothetical protein
MRKKISFVVLSNSGSSIKQFTISATFLRLFVFAFLISLGIFTYDYYSLKTAGIDTLERDIRIANQSDEIIHQRKQIQEFAEEISALKTMLVDLNNFEKKIRIIANIEKPDEQDSLFGVGGSIPEDLEAQMPLTQKHNSLLRGMHEQVEQLNLATINQEQSFESLFKYLRDQQNLLASTPAVRPSSGWTTFRAGQLHASAIVHLRSPAVASFTRDMILPTVSERLSQPPQTESYHLQDPKAPWATWLSSTTATVWLPVLDTVTRFWLSGEMP